MLVVPMLTILYLRATMSPGGGEVDVFAVEEEGLGYAAAAGGGAEEFKVDGRGRRGSGGGWEGR